jgi:hypothetical protein
MERRSMSVAEMAGYARRGRRKQEETRSDRTEKEESI